MQLKLVIKQGGEGSGLQRVHSLAFKMHAELRLAFKTWWSSEDTVQRLQCFFKLFASHINIQFRWAEGRCIRVSCLFLSSHSHKIVSLLEPVSYSADPVIAVWINSDPVIFLSFLPAKALSPWSLKNSLTILHAFAGLSCSWFVNFGTIALEVLLLNYSQLQE